MGTDVADALSNFPISSELLCIRLTCAALTLALAGIFDLTLGLVLISKIYSIFTLHDKENMS
jgi:hypothetical protein